MSLYRAITQGSEMSPRPPRSKAVLNSMFAVLLSVSGPALAQEELEGPGIFSGEKGEFSLSDIFSDKEEDCNGAGRKASGRALSPRRNDESHAKTNSTASARSGTREQNAVRGAQNTDEFTLFKAYKIGKI